jgi:mevalonate kinase
MSRAFGKVLLFGEHAVVHGVPAIAAGLPLDVVASVSPASDGNWHVESPNWHLSEHGDESRVVQAVTALANALDLPAPMSVMLDASVPAGAGLGSSAAMAISVGRALLEFYAKAVPDDALFDAAMAAERVFHGNPSGLDHMAAMRGGVFRFLRGQPPQVEPIVLATPLQLVIAQVDRGGDTGLLVAGVAQRRVQQPAIFDHLLATFRSVVDEATTALTSGHLTHVGEAMNINHGLLSAIGVSTAALDVAVHAARSAGALGAKLTGAGGGGCMIALVDDTTRLAVETALTPVSQRLWTVVLPC